MNSKLGFLLAGRDLPMRRMMSEVVDEMGHRTIHSTPRGTDAWATLKGKGADFIISQIQLKEMDGLTFLKIVRADKEFAYTPFLLLADLVTREQVVEAGEAGVSEILCRPITPMRIAEKVEELLNPSPDEKAVLAERHYQRGLNLMDQGQYEQALEAFSAVVSVHENAEVYYNLGYISAMMEKFEDAIMYFRKATEIDRFHVKAFQKMGECFQALGDDDAAKQYLERALEIIEGDFASEDQREDILKEVRSHKSDTINIFNSLGIILRREGKYDEAAAQYIKALRVHPKDENIHYNLGVCYLEAGRKTDAANMLEEALRIKPSFKEARELYVKVTRMLSDPDRQADA